MSKVIVIGGGAAGCIAAAFASKSGNEVLLLEKNERVGKKVLITGKGRCNLTNDQTDINGLISNVSHNGRFLYSAFSEFDAQDTKRLFEELGVPLKVERGNRVFPQSDKAADIVKALNKLIILNNVKKITAEVKELIIKDGRVLGVRTKEGSEFYADSVIVCTGGRSYPKTGSTGDGYKFALQAGHTLVPTRPSLVPLICREGFCSEAMGLSLRNSAIKVIDTVSGKEIYSDFGEMLFTHFGVSGPMILSASAHMDNMEKERYEINIDLKPALSKEKLDERLQRDLLENSNKALSNVLGLLLPRALINPIIRLSRVKPSTKANQLTKEERLRIVEKLKCLKLTVLDYGSFDEAVVTSGGVSCKEINPKTMESKLCKGLYFAGEVIDVDAYTGGFNLQIAFSTGYLAGKNA
ncbi:MAG: NAD(P)/FAD-dependent oxidoreductase [Clostridia bacterium]|nr:NAD(P)/FAD-dependent oxidoreductase [Clostridia bacterium]